MSKLQTQYEYDVISAVSKLIPNYHCIMVTNKKGDLEVYLSSEDFANSHKLSDMAEIAKLFSNRLRFGEYGETLGKFQLTTTVFETHYLIGRFISNDKILMISLAKNHVDLESKINKVIDIIKLPDLHEEKNLIALKENLKPIPPLPVDVQREREKLVSKKYMLVASPYEK